MYSSLILIATLIVLPFSSAKEQYSNTKMVCLVNKERTRYGLRPLSVNPQLTKAAQSHSDYQARSRKMSHTGSGGSNPGQRAKQAGYSWKSVGENVAYGYDTMASVMKTWMNSPGHRANILGKSYTCMGSAVAYAGSTPYYTQDFGAGGSTAGQNAPKCDGSDSDYNAAPSQGGNYGGQDDSMDTYGGGNDYGNNDSMDYGNDDYGGKQGGQKGGNDNYGNDNYGNDNQSDYGNDNGSDYGGEQGNHKGGKKPCKKGGKGGRKGNQDSEY